MDEKQLQDGLTKSYESGKKVAYQKAYYLVMDKAKDYFENNQMELANILRTTAKEILELSL